ncbi:hypothetical protein ACE6H2_010888 [Prunus campanulata]
MVSKSQNKEAQASKAKSGSKAQGDEAKSVSKAQVEEEKSTQSKPSKRMRFASTSEKDSSTATFVEGPKFGRGISTMSRVVKRRIEKVKPVVEFNKKGKPHGKAAVEMQSYIGVLARTRVPLVDKKWTQIPKDVREQIWEAVQMSYVIGDRYKEMVLSSAAKKWKDFKYNDDLQKQVSEGTLTVSGTNDILTQALGTPEHGGRVRGASAGVTPTQFFNLPKQQRVKFGDKLKESVREAVREETLRIEEKSRETIMEAGRAEREAMLAYIRQLVPNFDPTQMLKTPICPIPPIILPPQDQSPKNPMSDKASCSGATNIKPLALELEDPKPEADTAGKEKENTDLSKLDMPPPLLALCQHVQTKLLPVKEAVAIHMPKEVFGVEHDTFLLPEDILQFGSMVEIGTTVISVYMR